MIELIGTDDQKAKLLKRVKRPATQIAVQALAALGLEEAPYTFRIILRGTAKDVQDHFVQKYPGKGLLDSHSYTSREDATCYLSVEDVNERVLAHELAHAALNKYFTTDKVPNVLHELIAQAVEEKVCGKHSWFS
jgi:hypothetical protein